MRIIAFALVLLAVAATSVSAKTFKELFPDVAFKTLDAQKLAESFDYQQGEIQLPQANAKLKVPDKFYFLNAADARRVIVEVWGNPPSTADDNLGMILTADKTPLEDTWGAIITYDADGYVSDEDASKLDYSEMLRTMQEGTRAANEERAKAGFEPVKLVGWASPPFYDQASHKLHWAKELQFGDESNHTLNYSVRALGRHGVLAINFVAGIGELKGISAVIPDVMSIPEFKRGATYAEFQPGVDKVAAYGIGGLIAGKVAAKAGLFVLLAAFLKKGWILVLLLLGAVWKAVRSMMGKRAEATSGPAN